MADEAQRHASRIDASLRHELVIDHHPDAIYELDPEGRFRTGNTALETLLGRPIEELRTMSFARFVHRDDAERAAEEHRRVLAGEIRAFWIRSIGHDGKACSHLRVTNVPVVTDGAVTGIYGYARDVTEQLHTRSALEESEQRFRGLFLGSGVGMSITTLDGRFIDANPAFLDMLGYSLDELRATHFSAVTHPEDRLRNARDVTGLLTGTDTSLSLEKRYLDAHGDTVWVRQSVSLIRDADGTPIHFATTTEDITDQTLAKERLDRSESLLRVAGSLARVGGWSIEVPSQELFWSEEIYAILEVPPGKQPPLNAGIEMYLPEDRERLRTSLTACMERGTPFDLELRVETYRGRHLWVRAVGEARRGIHGRIERVLGAFQDISELKAANAEIADVARRLSATFESMTDAFYTLDHDWRFTAVNQRATQLLRRDRDELLGRQLWDELPGIRDSELYGAYQRAVETQTTVVLEEFFYAPLDVWLEVNVYPSDEGVAVYVRDVTARRTAREALEQREAALERQAALLDEAQDAIVVRDLDHRITYWNRSATRLYGWSPEEAIGCRCRDLLFNDTTVFDEGMAAVLRDGNWVGELTQRTRSGTALTVETRWTLLRDDQDRPEAVLAINTDVTERKRLERQFLRAQRLESIGTLAGGIAHDLNNVLAPIILAVEVLQADEPPVEQAELLDMVHASARRGADLIGQVLSFARGVEGSRLEVDVRQLLHDIERIVHDAFPKDIRLSVEISPDVQCVLGDSTQLQQVLINLAVNARDAMPEGGSLTIRAGTTTFDGSDGEPPDATPGDYVVIQVEDDGTGMEPHIRDRIFEPFFTTKPQGAGTGLGLSTAAAILRSHAGFLHVDSAPGHGSVFRLSLPVPTGPSQRAPAPGAPSELARGSGQTVLVVDDEDAVRAITRRRLEDGGYEVIEACDGAQAIAIYERGASCVDLVITDMTMPTMDGPATVRALRRFDADVRIVGASGLHDDGKIAQAADAGVEHFLPKPYTGRQLLEVVRDALEGPPVRADRAP